MVRAKFVVAGIEKSTTVAYEDGKPVDKEIRTIRLTPVYGNGDPKHENTKFFSATPWGEIKLGSVNPGAWAPFEPGAEFYVDFTKAAPPPVVKPTDD